MLHYESAKPMCGKGSALDYTRAVLRSWSFKCSCVLLTGMATMNILMAIPDCGRVDDLPWFQFERRFHEATLRLVCALGNIAVPIGAMLFLRGRHRTGFIVMSVGLLVGVAMTWWHVVAVHYGSENLSDKLTPVSLINCGPAGLSVVAILVASGVLHAIRARRLRPGDQHAIGKHGEESCRVR
jgi:hypothetical protein